MHDSSPISVVSYERISFDTSHNRWGITNQYKINLATAARCGWTVIGRFTDNNRSAAREDVPREGFKEMTRALRVGHLADGTSLDGVVVTTDDRLARLPGDCQRFIEALTCRSGRVFADANGPINLYDDDTRRLLLLGAAISEIEISKMQSRMRRSHRQRAERGISAGGTRPFGWNEDRITLHPAEAPLLRKAIEDFLTGRTIDSIVREWRKDQIKTSLGNDWTPQTLKLALWNPRICGWRRIGTPATGSLVCGDDGVPIVGKWETLASSMEWRQVAAIFENRRARPVAGDGVALKALPANRSVPKYLLAGLLRCGRVKNDGSICNFKMRCQGTRRDLPYHLYYCPGKTVGGCGGTARRGDLLDRYITESFFKKITDKSIVNLLAIRLRTMWDTDQLDIAAKRHYLNQALRAVIVYPAGKGRRAFDPELIKPIWQVERRRLWR